MLSSRMFIYLACDRGAVVAFLNEGQVGCFKEERLVGEKNVGSILKVQWSEKETYDARVLFFGKLQCYVLYGNGYVALIT